MKGKDGILGMFEQVMSKIHKPMLGAFKKWGQLSESPQGQKTIGQFKDNMEGFVTYMKSK